MSIPNALNHATPPNYPALAPLAEAALIPTPTPTVSTHNLGPVTLVYCLNSYTMDPPRWTLPVR